MLFLFSRISTWLFIELLATLILAVFNMLIPILMVFTSYRNLANFYLSSTALSSSLINYLYFFYLLQTIRAKSLSENNCRAFYYLQTSCIVVLAYTIVAMHANFVLCLFPSSSKEDRSTRRCFPSCGRCLRRFFRRFCFCFVILIWSVSFTSTIPLLYTIDSNEKSPKPVYCPGNTKINYLDEWVDQNRIMQTVICNLIPLLLCLCLSLIALAKLFYDCGDYFYYRLRMSYCFFAFRNQSIPILSYRSWFPTSFLRFIFVLSCCLLACIYPIVMRFYLVYFSVLVPLIFTIFNYSLTQSSTIFENQANTSTISPTVQANALNPISVKIVQTNDVPNEQLELRSPSIVNLSTTASHPQSPNKTKPNYAVNQLYENTRHISRK